MSVAESERVTLTTYDGRPMTPFGAYITLVTSKPARWYYWPQYRFMKFITGCALVLEAKSLGDAVGLIKEGFVITWTMRLYFLRETTKKLRAFLHI